MTTKPNNERTAARVFHPGEILLDELNERQLTQAEFSAIIGRPARTVNEIIKGKRSITPETAEMIGAALGTSPEMWLSMQSEYDIFLLNKKFEQQTKDVRRRSQLYNLFPIADLVRRKYLAARTKKPMDIEKEVLKLLGLDSISEFENANFALLRVSDGDIIQSYLKTWILLGKKAAKELTGVGTYKKEALTEFSKEIKNYSRQSDGGVAALIQKLLELGVRVIVLPHFSKTRVDGAACWIEDDGPVILLSLRLDRIDNFYFTILHEIGHIVLHNGEAGQPFIDTDIYSSNDDQKEKEANEFSTKNLGFSDIASELQYSELSPSLLSRKSEQLGVHPGLLIGHLQHKHLLDYSAYRKVLVRVKDSVPDMVMQK